MATTTSVAEQLIDDLLDAHTDYRALLTWHTDRPDRARHDAKLVAAGLRLDLCITAVTRAIEGRES